MRNKNQLGFIALTSVLIIFALTLIIATSFTLKSINEATMGLKKNQSSQAYYLANLCAEQALLKLKEDIDYTGNETVLIKGGSCQILPIEGRWTIKVLGSFQNNIKKVKIVVSQVNPKMVIYSWEEIKDF